MWNKLQNVPIIIGRKQQIIFILFTLMMIGLFFSRALLSMSMIIFVIYSFFHSSIKNQFRKFFSTPLLWGMSILFFLPLVSGLWSNDKKAWLDIMQIKLPLLFTPLGFASSFVLSKKDWERLAFIFILLVVSGSIWSMMHYLSDPLATQQAYLRSQIIATPLENDHVRFSWLVSISILIAAWLGLKKREKDKIISWSLFAVAVWLVIFLHILAARTGLLSFYLITVLIAIWFIVKKLNILYGLSLLFLISALPFAAYFIFPTFQNRVKYFFYDLPYFNKAHYLPQTTDAVRVISMKAGWRVMNENPFTGVGFGDILSQTKKLYAENYPQMKEEDKIYPSNEWLVYGDGCGWPGFILFTVIIFIPFFMRHIQQKFLWFTLNISALCLLLFDIGLEIQFGVFIYSFVLLCWWKRATMEI